jgi:hypothetical protein
LKRCSEHFGTKIVGQKRCYFKKRTGEVTENKGLATKNEPERTEKRSGEVVENTFLWKKQSQNEPKTKRKSA